jgi:hypothetical protein
MPVWFACNAALRSSSQMARPRAAAQQSADQNKRLARTLPEGDGRTKREARMQTRRCRRRANTKEQTAATRSRATTRAGSSCRPRASGRGQRSSRPQIRLSFRCRHSSQNQVKVCVMEAQPPRPPPSQPVQPPLPAGPPPEVTTPAPMSIELSMTQDLRRMLNIGGG